MQYIAIEPAVRSQWKWFQKPARMEDVSAVADFMIQNGNLTEHIRVYKRSEH
jgi:hypothetical protein